MASGRSALSRVVHSALGIGTIFVAHHAQGHSWIAIGTTAVAVAYVAWMVGGSVAATAATAASALTATTIVDGGVSFESALALAVALPVYFAVAYAGAAIEVATRPTGINPAGDAPSGSDEPARDGARSVPS